MLTPSGDICSDPSFIFVCDSNIGSSTLTAIAATMPFLMSVNSKFFWK